MIQSNEVKQWAGSLVNLPPNGSPQDMGGAEGYGRGLQPYLRWRDPHFGSAPLGGGEGKGILRICTVYIFHSSFKLAHEYLLSSGPSLRKWGEKIRFKITWTYLGAQGKYKSGFDFFFYLVPSLETKALFLHEAQERTEIGFKFLFNAKARNLTTQHFLPVLL